MNIPPAEQPRGRTSLDEYGRGAESDCARAMAEIERVLHELALTRRSSRERLSPANEAPKAPSLVPAPSPIDRLVLDAGLTEAGFRRMGQAHSAGLDTVIEVDQRYRQMSFLNRGYDVYVSDAVERGRASWARYPEFFKSEPLFRSKKEAWELFRFGPTGSYEHDRQAA